MTVSGIPRPATSATTVLAAYSDGGPSFIVTHATAVDGTIWRIQRPKNLAGKVVTEHGVAELRGRTIRQRALALIAIAAARGLAYL